jgi:hypothetical protein
VLRIDVLEELEEIEFESRDETNWTAENHVVPEAVIHVVPWEAVTNERDSVEILMDFG